MLVFDLCLGLMSEMGCDETFHTRGGGEILMSWKSD